jgi:hypothetical protein
MCLMCDPEAFACRCSLPARLHACLLPYLSASLLATPELRIIVLKRKKKDKKFVYNNALREARRTTTSKLLLRKASISR